MESSSRTLVCSVLFLDIVEYFRTEGYEEEDCLIAAQRVFRSSDQRLLRSAEEPQRDTMAIEGAPDVFGPDR